MKEVSLAEHPEVGRASHIDLEEGQQSTPQLEQTREQGYTNNHDTNDNNHINRNHNYDIDNVVVTIKNALLYDGALAV